MKDHLQSIGESSQRLYQLGELNTIHLCLDQSWLTLDVTESLRALAGHCQVTILEETPDSDTLPENEALLILRQVGNGIEANFASNHGQQKIVRHIEKNDEQDNLEQKRQLRWGYKKATFQVMRPFFASKTPWGSLTGIRPTKLFRQISNQQGEIGAEKYFASEFSVSPQKIALLHEISMRQASIFASIKPNDFDLYVGIPFCPTRCEYCSFAATELQRNGHPIAWANDLVGPYVDALCDDIEKNLSAMKVRGQCLRAVYVGGGTPTALSSNQLQQVLETIQNISGGYGAECSVEAGRPDSIDKEKLTMLKEMNVTRISINPQSMVDETLLRIGRKHSSADLVAAYELARTLDFAHINMDIILGLPGEGVKELATTLETIKKMGPDALTVHALALKRASRLREELIGKEEKGRLERDMAMEDQAQEMQAMSSAAAAKMDLFPYYVYRQKYSAGNLENTGYAAEGMASIYNVDIMEEAASILALGAGGISKKIFGDSLERLANPKDPKRYMETSEEMTKQRMALWDRQS